MHSVTRSATSTRSGTLVRITGCALELADRCGFDGFTMDDLAGAAGLSRRTLFNYFPSKADAVLGEWPTLGDDAVAEFRAGGPHHDLLLDLRALILPCLKPEAVDRSIMVRFKRVLQDNPRLLAVVHHHFEEVSGQIVAQIAAREGSAFGADRARVAVRIITVLFCSAIDVFIDDPAQRSVAHHFDESLRTARSLLGT